MKITLSKKQKIRPAAAPEAWIGAELEADALTPDTIEDMENQLEQILKRMSEKHVQTYRGNNE